MVENNLTASSTINTLAITEHLQMIRKHTPLGEMVKGGGGGFFQGAELKLRAKRKLGELLKLQRDNQGGDCKSTFHYVMLIQPTLKDQGISEI